MDDRMDAQNTDVPVDIDDLADNDDRTDHEDLAAAGEAEEATLDEDSPEVLAASEEFLQQWDRLVSTTNWEKGHIISEWRRRLIASGASQNVYSDEAWARRIGNISGQHVGRLRRVYDQFGESYQQYSGLYWSHFQAVLDWDDAEMWLEGAVQNGWSVAQMRAQRWEATGAPQDQKPAEDDIVTAEFDEDVDPIDSAPSDSMGDEVDVVRDVDGEEVDSEAQDSVPFDVDSDDSATAVDPVRPFEGLPKLPDDLQDAFEVFKLAILSHRIDGWKEVSCGDVLAALDSLKALALAPPDA